MRLTAYDVLRVRMGLGRMLLIIEDLIEKRHLDSEQACIASWWA